MRDNDKTFFRKLPLHCAGNAVGDDYRLPGVFVGTEAKAVTTISGPAYFIIQHGRTYFENRDKLEFIRANFNKVHEVSINGMTAAEVFVNEPK